jgi:hypothetical protein
MGVATFLIAMAFAMQSPAVQDVEQRLGPFTFAGQTFTVVLDNKRLTNPADVRFSQTLALVEIRDQANTVQYQKTIPFQISGGRFQQAVSASARLISGNGLAGLLIHYTRERGAESWQIFRLKDGKLALLDVPINSSPITSNGIIAGAILRSANGAVSRINPMDTVELKAWGGNFSLIVPLRVDWQQGRTMPGQQCFEMAGPPGLKESACEMRVEAMRKPGNEEFTFIRLFNEANENMGTPRHVVIKKDAKIEYLAGKAIVKWTANGDESSIALTDVWLKVLIDDNEENLGWIHSDEDFSAVGLPAGSPVP